jgi:hypothetical protein
MVVCEVCVVCVVALMRRRYRAGLRIAVGDLPGCQNARQPRRSLLTMFKIRIHGRGGQGVTAAQLLSVSAFDEGCHAQECPCGAIEMVEEQI